MHESANSTGLTYNELARDQGVSPHNAQYTTAH